MNQPPNIAIVGVTGAVGQELLKLIEQRGFAFGELRLLASARSAGKQITFVDRTHTIQQLTADSFDGIDIALFSAGGSISKQFAPRAVEAGAVVVDNSSAYRMDPDTPLVVPEVNPEALDQHQGIIANPNCSTIIMNLPVYPLHRAAGVKRLVVSTYQAASGAGAAAMSELEQQARDWVEGKPITQAVFGRQYIWNLFSHDSDVDGQTGYNTEETKMIHETRKIFDEPAMKLTATCIRVPVLRAHCEAINLTFDRALSVDEARQLLAEAPGVRMVDDRDTNRFPEPLEASGQDDVLVGRLRPDLSQDDGMGLEMFIAGDQIRKGAALNALQIAEHLLQRVAV